MYDDFGWEYSGFAHAFGFIVYGLVALLSVAVTVAVIFFFVRFLIYGTKAAQLYIAKNTPQRPAAAAQTQAPAAPAQTQAPAAPAAPPAPASAAPAPTPAPTPTPEATPPITPPATKKPPVKKTPPPVA